MTYRWKYNAGQKFELFVTSAKIQTFIETHEVQGSVFRSSGCDSQTPFQAAMVYKGRMI